MYFWPSICETCRVSSFTLARSDNAGSPCDVCGRSWGAPRRR